MIIFGFENSKWLLKERKIFLVCGKSFSRLPFAEYINGLRPIRFEGFKANPLYEEVMNGVMFFNNSGCDTILAVGGGSAIDVAKGIKFYSKCNVDIIAIPTTAGTGSEVTHFSVIYKDGVKQSIAEEKLLPKYAVLEPSALLSVPMYVRKATMLDALCHSIESYWAKKATIESRRLSTKAISEILAYKISYLKNEEMGNAGMLRAANLAGKAINMTTTTAAHAMCYKITTLYGFAHGHSAALCLPEVWRVNKIDVPGITVDEFVDLFDEMGLEYPTSNSKEDELRELINSVNIQRLENNPVKLNEDMIRQIYARIIK